VELIIQMSCIGIKQCTFCKKEAYTQTPYQLKHYINISVTQMSPVYYTVDRVFDNNPSWVFIQLPVASMDVVRNLWQFVLQQLDKPYNGTGCCFNMLCGYCCCCCCGSYCGAGKRRKFYSSEDNNMDYAEDEPTKWFCSELVVATLQHVGYTDQFNIEPRLSTPQTVFDLATTVVGAVTTLHPLALKQPQSLHSRHHTIIPHIQMPPYSVSPGAVSSPYGSRTPTHQSQYQNNKNFYHQYHSREY
jgi:hypothetical protein